MLIFLFVRHGRLPTSFFFSFDDSEVFARGCVVIRRRRTRQLNPTSPERSRCDETLTCRCAVGLRPGSVVGAGEGAGVSAGRALLSRMQLLKFIFELLLPTEPEAWNEHIDLFDDVDGIGHKDVGRDADDIYCDADQNSDWSSTTGVSPRTSRNRRCSSGSDPGTNQKDRRSGRSRA